MFLIGDVHGAFKTYEYILNKMQLKGGKKGMDCTLQVGDMGIGFPKRSGADYLKDGKSWSPELQIQHKFLRGNHDDPKLCNEHPNYLGDYGFCEYPNLFYVGGGYSIDYQYRIPGVSWWEDEQLSMLQSKEAFELYVKTKPRIMVSHECPSDLKPMVVVNNWKFEVTSSTEILLQEMLAIHRPEFWIFGHHHKYLEVEIEGTKFVALGEMMDDIPTRCIYEIPGITWE